MGLLAMLSRPRGRSHHASPCGATRNQVDHGRNREATDRSHLLQQISESPSDLVEMISLEAMTL